MVLDAPCSMATTLAIFSALVIAMSLYDVIWPPEILVFARRCTVRPGIWVAAGIRLLAAVLLWATSPICQTPMVFKVLASLALVAAVALPAMGTARLVDLVERLESWPTMVVRLQGLFGVCFGAFVLWPIWPASTA